MKTLIYIYPQKSSFINSDIDFLSKYYNVKTQDLQWGSANKLILNWLLQFLFLIKNIWSSEVIVISFGGYFSLLPILFGKVFGKKTFLILNGTDCVSFPEYNYGSLRKQPLKLFINYSLQFATKLLPVDASLILQTHTFDENIVRKSHGFLSFFPEIKTEVSVIPNGFNTNFWKIEKDIQRKNDFITVLSAGKKSTAIFKGIDLIIEVAKKYPKKSFTIVGLSEQLQQEFSVSKNITFIKFVPKETLKNLYNSHQFYLQLSINEGFGCALTEAMLCGCIPVVSNTGALPNVAGKDAFLIEKRTPKNISAIFTTIIKLDDEAKRILSQKSRMYSFKNFKNSIREELLLQEIK